MTSTNKWGIPDWVETKFTKDYNKLNEKERFGLSISDYVAARADEYNKTHTHTPGTRPRSAERKRRGGKTKSKKSKKSKKVNKSKKSKK